jgi:hypothetical protein
MGEPSLTERVLRLEEILGASPDPVLGTPGRGLLGAVDTLVRKLDIFASAELARIEAEAKRRALWLTVAKIAVPLVGAVAGVVRIITGLHH